MGSGILLKPVQTEHNETSQDGLLERAADLPQNKGDTMLFVVLESGRHCGILNTKFSHILGKISAKKKKDSSVNWFTYEMKISSFDKLQTYKVWKVDG